MKKKSQISSQVFIYILAAVIIGLIALVGMKAINTMLAQGKQINIDTFQNDFESKVSTTSRQYGSVSKFEFSLSDTFDSICFLDSFGEDGKFPASLEAKAENVWIKDSVSNNVPMNVFLMKNEKILNSFYVERMDVSEDYLCLVNTGRNVVWFKGSGKTSLLYTQEE